MSSNKGVLTQDEKNKIIEKAQVTLDAYSNALARLGVDQPNLISASDYPLKRWSHNEALMTSLYRNDWIAKRIVDMPAEDMTKRWFTIESQLEPDAIKQVEKTVRRQKVKKKITDALKWARLYGGSAAVMLIDGHQDMMYEPLDIDEVMPDSFRGLLVLDRWSGIAPETELVTDMTDTEFGMPLYYNIFKGNISMRVHHSRVLRFVGRELPQVEEDTEMSWGASELEHVFDELNKRNSTSANIAQLIFQANLRVLKMDDLGQVLAMGDERSQKTLYQTIQAQNRLMSSSGVQVLDATDSMETHQYTFGGLADIYSLFMADVAGAAEIPATKLFGRSPEGMNATGESDLDNYYESIEQKQEYDLRPALEKLMPVIFVSALGAVPDDWDIVFEAVQTVSEEARANLAEKTSNTVMNVYAADLIKKSTALKELKSNTVNTGMWSTITDEEIEAADQEAQLEAEQNPNETQGLLPPPEALNNVENTDSFWYNRGAKDAEFSEADVKRDKDGRFAEKSGGKSDGKPEPDKKQEEEAQAPSNEQENESKPERKPPSPERLKEKEEQRAKQLKRRGTSKKTVELSEKEWDKRRRLANKVDKGFSKKKFDEHWADHAVEYPDLKDKYEYQREAMKLAGQRTGKDIRGHVRGDGTIARYKRSTNDYVLYRPGWCVISYYKPERGEAYYEDEERRWAYKGDNGD